MKKFKYAISKQKDEQHASMYHCGDGGENRQEEMGVDRSFELLTRGDWEIRIASGWLEGVTGYMCDIEGSEFTVEKVGFRSGR